MSGAGDKTEAPTPKRKKEAREKGQVAKTPELSTWATLLATLVLLRITFEFGTEQLSELISRMGQLIANPDANLMVSFLTQGFVATAIIVAPVAIGIMLIGVTTEMVQTGRPSTKRLKPDFKRLNPAKGFKRMLSPRTLWELLKAVAKVGILVLVAVPVLREAFNQLLTGGLAIDEVLPIVGETLMTMLRNVAIAGLMLAAADWAYQKYTVNKQLKMTKQEVREEMRHSEGDQMVKHQLRQRARALSQNRMIASVADADVVLVNPTHYAVALRYTAARGAPEVTAKGKGYVALRIREQAAEAGVPILSDPPLARTLHSLCDVGKLIPPDLYEAVARVLAYVMGVRRRGMAGGILELPSSMRA